MRTNKYAAKCDGCGNRVAARCGTLTKEGRRWSVRHRACQTQPSVTRARFYGGRGPGTYEDVYQNNNGRCEDAPCCGCCS